MPPEDSWKPLLEHLGRGANFGYYWQVSGKKKLTTWYPTHRIPNPPADQEGSLYFGVHGTAAIPRRIQPETGQPRDRGLLRNPKGIRAQVADVCAVNCLFAEFDAKDFGGNKVTALAAVERVPVAPSRIIDSGGGFHCYWLLDQPQLVSDENRVELARLQARWVDFACGDPASRDLARVLRVPGSLNRKYSPPRPVSIVRGSGKLHGSFQLLYTLGELEACLPPPAVAPLPLAVAEFAGGLGGGVVIRAETVEETAAYWISRARLEIEKQGSQNSAALWLACQLRDSGLDQAQVEAFVWQFLCGLPELRAGEPWTAADAERISRSAFSHPARKPAVTARPPAVATSEPEFEPMEEWIMELDVAGEAADEQPVAAQDLVGRGRTLPETRPEHLAPALPEYARPDAELARTVGGWLDLYTGYALKISPMTPKSFHESAALFMGSVVIARRIKIDAGHGDTYPNLFFAWLAPTTLYKKTTGLNIARRILLREFPHLLTPQDFTTESFISDLAGQEPCNLQSASPAEQEAWHKERDFAAQRGLVLDEFSGLLASTGKDYNGGMLEAILHFYDCDPLFVRTTRSQGRVTVRNAYLSLLGASTPAAVGRHLTQERLWDMGWWPRFILVTPEARPAWQEPEATVEPQEISGRLQRLARRLPAAQWPAEHPVITASIAPEAQRAYKEYSRGCHEMLSDDFNTMLLGAYGRLPTQALKTALILAALDWPDGLPAPHIEARHMACALLLAEEWRASIHRALEQTNISEYSKFAGRLIGIISQAGTMGITFRDIARAMQDKAPSEISAQLGEMMRAQQIEKFVRKPQGRGRPSECYRVPD